MIITSLGILISSLLKMCTQSFAAYLSLAEMVLPCEKALVGTILGEDCQTCSVYISDCRSMDRAGRHMA